MKSKFKKGLISLGTAAAIAAPIIGATSCSLFDDGYKISDGEIISYIKSPGDDLREKRRILDNNYIPANYFAGDAGSATNFSVIRTWTSGDGQKNKEGQFVPGTTREFNKSITEGFEMGVSTSQYFSDLTSETAQQAFSGAFDEIRIRLKNNKEIFYAKVEGGKVVKTDVKFSMKDMFYGFVRSLYAVSSVSSEGKIADKSVGLDPFSDETIKEMEKNSSNRDLNPANPNSYLFELYGIDLKATVEINKNMTTTDDFVIKMLPGRGLTTWDVTLNLFADTSNFSPVPSEIIDKLAQKHSEANTPEIKYGILNYGINKYLNNKAVDTSFQNYSIAPYLYSSFDENMGGIKSVSINPFYTDQSLVNKKNVAKKYTTIRLSSVSDPNGFIANRKQGYYDAKFSHEYLLNSEVNNSLTASLDINKKGYYLYEKPRLKGPKNNNFAYALWGAIDNDFNDKGREIIWGQSTKDKAFDDAGNNAIDQFFSGTGSDLRAAVNSAINWYSTIRNYKNNSSLSFWSNFAYEGSFKDSGVQDLFTDNPQPSYMDTIEDMNNIYSKNIDDTHKQYNTNKMDNAKKMFEELAKKVGATKADPAIIPLFDATFTDITSSPSVKKTSDEILKHLNNLTEGKIVFKWKSWTKTVLLDSAYRNPSSFLKLSSWGPDYDGLGTIFGQYLSEFGNFGVIYVLRRALGISQTEALPGQQRMANGNFSLMMEKLAKYQTDYPEKFDLLTKEKVNTIGIGDIHKMMSHDSDFSKTEDFEILSQMKDFINKYTFDVNKDPAALKELIDFLRENNPNAYSATGYAAWTRFSSVIPDLKSGERKYYRHDLGFIPQYTAGNAIDLLHTEVPA